MADPNRRMYAAPFGALPASSIAFVAVADNTIPVLVDAMAACIQSGDRVERAVGHEQIDLAAIELADFWRVTPEKPIEGYHYFPGA